MAARLVVSLSGIGPSTLARCVELAADLDRRSVPLSLLLAPRRAVEGEALDWVRLRLRAGDALVQHGSDLRADPFSPRRRAEFAALPAHEAGLRLIAARAAFARLGLATDLFAPPGWAVSAGALVALARHRFALCADAAGVRDLRTGGVLPGRVRRVGGDHWRYLLGVRRALRRGALVRVAVDAADLDRLGPRQAVLDAVDLALAHAAEPTTYRLLLAVTARSTHRAAAP
ncbi:DUF2334 domain-containing protein [Saccharothrix coeruleofusca]|uniref:DUF2334 domain-containing protein n=1 Tax=Saccharothrix coeruleofusca TaxID=33919 RepID=UPI001671102E|nr:DUF2334 domain-containing protein [Saccharothrix coeruleofusca]